MTPLFKKLNFKQHKEILILNYPTEFESEMKAMKDYTTIKKTINNTKEIEFVLTFVKTKLDIDTMTSAIRERLKGDGIVWFAYPKKTSKKYKAETKDSDWEVLGNFGLESVRSVAVDKDWSAVRFRRIEFVKKRYSK